MAMVTSNCGLWACLLPLSGRALATVERVVTDTTTSSRTHTLARNWATDLQVTTKGFHNKGLGLGLPYILAYKLTLKHKKFFIKLGSRLIRE